MARRLPNCPKCGVEASQMQIEPQYTTIWGAGYWDDAGRYHDSVPVTLRSGPDCVTVYHKICELSWVFYVSPDAVPTAVPEGAVTIEYFGPRQAYER